MSEDRLVQILLLASPVLGFLIGILLNLKLGETQRIVSIFTILILVICIVAIGILWFIKFDPINPLPLLFIAPLWLAIYLWPISFAIFVHGGLAVGTYVRQGVRKIRGHLQGAHTFGR